MPFPFGRGGKKSEPCTPTSEAAQFTFSETDSPAFSKELTRLKNELVAKTKSLEEADKEITTLKLTVGAKDKALQKLSEDCEKLNNTHLKSEESRKAVLNRVKELEHERIKLQSESSEALRKADKLHLKLNVATSVNQDEAQHKLTALKDKIEALTSELSKAKEENRTCNNIIRSKDKELATAAAKVKEFEVLTATVKEFENTNADMKRQIKEARQETQTLEGVVRAKDAELQALSRRVEESTSAAAAANALVGQTKAEVQLVQGKLKASESELSLNKAELVRVKKVASRVVVSEHSVGEKEGGTVPLTRHLEEVHFLQGQVDQLKKKLQLVEASVETMRAYQDKYHQLISPAKDGSATPMAGNGKTPKPVRTTSSKVDTPATKGKARLSTPKSNSSKGKDSTPTFKPKAGSTTPRNKDLTPRAKANRLATEDSAQDKV